MRYRILALLVCCVVAVWLQSDVTNAQTPSITGGTLPPKAGGFGLFVFGPGTSDQLVTASQCPRATAAFWVTDPGGNFVAFVPASTVAVVNAAWNGRFANGIPAGTPVIGKCADPGSSTGATNNPSTSGASTTNMLTVQLGPAEIVLGPSGLANDPYANLVDNPFNSVTSSTGILAYIGAPGQSGQGGETWGFSGPTIDNLTRIPQPVLRPAPDFDSGGAWLNSAIRDGSLIRAWYHAEAPSNGTNCTGPDPGVMMSVGYAESTDNGLHFVQRPMPVIQGPAGKCWGEGDQHVIRDATGNFYYMYYIEHWELRPGFAHHRLFGTVSHFEWRYPGNVAEISKP